MMKLVKKAARLTAAAVMMVSLAVVQMPQVTFAAGAFLGTPAPDIDISDAEISASTSPVYNGGEMIAPDDFGIEVTLDSMPLSKDSYGLNFYSDVSCTPGEEVVVTDAGVYYVLATGNESEGYIGQTAAIRVKVLKACLPKPEAVGGTITYDGTEKTGVKLPDGADASKYVISGDKATEAGVHTATIALADDDNYCWSGENGDPEDGTISQPFTIDWGTDATTPATGDTVNMTRFVLLLLVAGVAEVVLLAHGRKIAGQ